RFAVCTLALVALLLSPPPLAVAAPERVSVAVLPFEQQTPREEDKYLSAGFAETLTNALARVGNLQVIERGHIRRVLDELKLQSSGLVDPAKAAQVGKQVGAKQVVVGSFMRAGNAMRVICRFVDVETAAIDPQHTATITRPLTKEEEIFDLLDQLAGEVVKGFGVETTAEVKQQLGQVVHQTKDPRAFEYYTQAREKMLLGTRQGMTEAIPLFEKAVAEDKEYALAWAGLSLALNGLGLAKYENGEDGQPEFKRSLAAAKKAVEIKPDLSDAHIALAMAYGPRVEGTGSDEERKRKREEAARKAVELDPKNALAHYNLWAALDGPLEGEGFSHIEKAIELDPKLLVARANLGMRYNAAQRFAEAIPHFKA
ncbi:MAG: CsgG/HfaB family protein, partial [Armatimonadota bacterium]|nr:CsgG/HfaB family protein [Armatimonadota bacterium]